MTSNASDSEPSTQLKRVLDIAWRRKWWVIVPALLATATSLVLVGITPKAYRATTTILVTRQGVPDQIARSSVTLRIEERMRSLELQIFSRSYLEQVAREFKLVPANAGEAEIEAACLKLRARVIPELDRQSFSWFRISVEDIDPERAAGIANRLAGLFIEENSQLRASQATGTREATESWEQKYRLELDKRDEEISTFKKQNLHELPDQQPANEQLLQDAQNNVASLTTALQSANDRLVKLRTERDGDRAIPLAPGLPDAAAGGEAGHLATLQRELEGLRTGYTEENPLVKRKRAQIAELVRSLPADVVAGTAEDPAVAARLDSSSVQIAAVEDEIGTLERGRAREIARVYAFRARIRNAPRLQPKILELTRDSDQAKRELDIAVVQNEQAHHLQDLEESKTGDQLQIQDRAFPPTAPFRPKLFDYLVIGVSLGIVIGVGAAAGREFVDQSVRSEDAFAVLFPDLSVYGVIPRLDVGLKPKRRLA